MEAKSLGMKMLGEGASPPAVLAAIIDPAFDSDFSGQQYGIVALGREGRPVTYNGAATPGWKGDLKGYRVSVQGNILADAKALRHALAAFQRAAKDKRASRHSLQRIASDLTLARGRNPRCAKGSRGPGDQ